MNMEAVLRGLGQRSVDLHGDHLHLTILYVTHCIVVCYVTLCYVLCYIGIFRRPPFRGPLIVSLYVVIQPYIAKSLYK